MRRIAIEKVRVGKSIIEARTDDHDCLPVEVPNVTAHGSDAPKVPWYHGTMIPWYHSIILPWYHSTIRRWYHGTMVPWYHSTMVPWYHKAIVRWYHGLAVLSCASGLAIGLSTGDSRLTIAGCVTIHACKRPRRRLDPLTP